MIYLGDAGTLIITIIMVFLIGLIASYLLVKGLKFINAKYLNGSLLKNKMSYFNVILFMILIVAVNQFLMIFEGYQDIVWVSNSDIPTTISLVLGFIMGLDFPYVEEKEEDNSMKEGQ